MRRDADPPLQARGHARYVDDDRARELAIGEFSRRNLILSEWDIHGPRVMSIAGLSSQCLVFDFVPVPEHNRSGRRFPLRIAVDPHSGETDMLR